MELWASRGIKGKGTGLTFDTLQVLSDLFKKDKQIPSRTNTQPQNLKRTNTARCMLYKKVLDLLIVESIYGESSGRTNQI